MPQPSKGLVTHNNPHFKPKISASASNDGAGKDDITNNIANEILNKLPTIFDEATIKRANVKVTPTSVVLFQEIARFNRLINSIRESLINLRKVYFINR